MSKDFTPLTPALIGVPAIDSQHQQLYGYLNDFIRLNVQKNASRSAVKEALDQIFNYTVFHFDDEELFMQYINYPKVEQHIKLHQELRLLVNQYYTRFENEEDLNAFTNEIIYFLKDWLSTHILGQDADIAHFYRSSNSVK